MSFLYMQVPWWWTLVAAVIGPCIGMSITYLFYRRSTRKRDRRCDR